MTDLELWDDKQLAKRLSVADQTPRAWRLRGGGPPFVRLGRRIRYQPRDVEKFISEQPRFHSTAEYPKPEEV